MARTTPSTVVDLGLEDDEPYVGLLVSAEFKKSNKADYPDQVLVKWELRQGGILWDYIGISLGLQAATKQPSKLRQLLNALAERPKDAEVWFDGGTLEWGYDLGSAVSPAYAVLTPGMAVTFKGEKRKSGDGTMRYKVTGYKTLNGAKPKERYAMTAEETQAAQRAAERERLAAMPIDVDPDEIPF